MIDDERLHAGDAVFRRRRDQRESANHGAADHVVELAQRRGGALALQDLKDVAVIRGRRVHGVALFDRLGHRFADRAAVAAVGVLPVQAVLLARRADDALRVLVHA